MKKPKSIITYLVEGTPNGIRTIELSNWIGKGICFPRARLKAAKQRPELQQPGIYFLFGENDQGKAAVYVGEAETLAHRLSHHDAKKDFWSLAICFTSKDQNLTKADVKYLESRSIEISQNMQRFALINTNKPSINTLPEYQAASMEEFLENIQLLTASLGFPLLEPLVQKDDQGAQHQYSVTAKGAQAHGIYNENGMVVLAGSTCSKNFTASTRNHIKSLQSELIASGILEEAGDYYKFTSDYCFSSPSTAAVLIMGRSANGWTAWKDKNANTLSDNER